MTTLVVDCSVTIPWIVEDEATDETEALLDQLTKTTAKLPAIWSFEVGNFLIQAVRRGRIIEDSFETRLAVLAALPIIVAEPLDTAGIRRVAQLGTAQGLTAYDAAYLDLALREGVPLASLDARLRAAAEARGVAVLPG